MQLGACARGENTLTHTQVCREALAYRTHSKDYNKDKELGAYSCSERGEDEHKLQRVIKTAGTGKAIRISSSCTSYGAHQGALANNILPFNTSIADKDAQPVP